ncbi:uncharacterized protein PFL1_02935 [Pseudozyma flocculosa PF-1]|uniref:Major allergen Mal f 1 n=2 Tax=Pseudozyma flocculosa TaxID=84751 RepID=A0A061HCE6_9BASI|nr:uncharacterized protein PFL1_02935 [Pseudozyma flocculosa PF-1]EPQ29715.1 hypothetical protein PFL1_02935 [Pseudozyma flocculosa PF-1]SPO38292.1 probable Major allergen Mal f 1 precursor [Pseudozyma flocculosa]
MRFTLLSAAIAAAIGCATLAPSHAAPVAPDSYSIRVKNLYPEDTVYDRTRNLFYQSNLWKGRISVWNPANSDHYNLLIPGVSSSGDGAQQMAGLSIDTRSNAKRLYGVAKDSAAFRFGPDQSKTGPCSFHAFDLPATAASTPVWSVYFDAVQRQFEASTGTRPFGPVDSAQDSQGNSYVVFALGIPAIAKVSPDGKNVEAWFAEASNGSQRPGYTGVAFDSRTNRLVAYGGPRPITSFDLSQPTATATPVALSGASFGSLDGTEKLTFVSSGGKSILVGAKAPSVYAFTSTDGWKSASVKSFTRPEFQTNSLTVVTEARLGGVNGIYGGGAYFAEGAKGGRIDNWLYKIPNSILA